MRFNSFSSELYFVRAQCNKDLFVTNGKEEYFKLAINDMNKSQELDKFHPRYIAAKAQLYSYNKDFKNSSIEFYNLIKCNPIKIEFYEWYASSISNEYVSDKKELQSHISSIPNMISKGKEKLSPIAYKLNHKPNLQLTPKLVKLLDDAAGS